MENNQISKSYQKPLTLQNRSLVEYCVQKEEYDLILAIENNKIGTLNKESISALIDILAKWRWMLGVNNNDTETEIAKQLALLSQYIIKHYENLTINEIELAIDLSFKNNLDVDANSYNNFSVLYVTKILNSYLEYRKEKYKIIMDRKDHIDNKKESEKKATPEVRMQGIIELIEYFYYEFKSGNGVNDYFNTLYNYFRRTGKLNVEKKLVDEAMEYGKIEAENHINNVYHNALSSEKPNMENIIKRFARNYCVERYFDKNGLDIILSQVNISEFRDV